MSENTMTSSSEKAELVLEYMRQTNGSEQFFRHTFLPVVYTEGMRYVAETCGAYWLIDLIGSWQPKVRRKLAGTRNFQVWELARHSDGQRWIARCWSDTPNKSTVLARQVIGYSDFPEELLPFTCWCVDGTILLKEEY